MRKRDISAVAYGLLLAALCAGVAGCERAAARSSEEQAAPAPAPAPAVQPAVSSSDSDEAAYQAQLGGLVKEQQKKAKTHAHIQKRLRDMEARARAALPAGATPEQVRAELEGNPQKYPAYHGLVRAEAASKAAARDFSKARETIRAHHMQRNPAGNRAQGTGTASN